MSHKSIPSATIIIRIYEQVWYCRVPYLLSLTFSCYLWVWCLIAFGAPMIKLSKGSTYIKPSCQQYVRKKETRKPFLWAFDNQRIGIHVALLQYFWASVHIFCYFFLMRNRTRFVEKQGFSRVLEQLRFCAFQARKSLIHICMFNCLHKKRKFWAWLKKMKKLFLSRLFCHVQFSFCDLLPCNLLVVRNEETILCNMSPRSPFVLRSLFATNRSSSSTQRYDHAGEFHASFADLIFDKLT